MRARKMSREATADTVRRTAVRALFVRSGGEAVLLTAWASLPVAPGAATCEPVPCPPCDNLRCECPPPKCELVGLASTADPLDAAIVESLRAT